MHSAYTHIYIHLDKLGWTTSKKRVTQLKNERKKKQANEMRTMQKIQVKLFCKFIIILCWIGCGMCDDVQVPAMNSVFNQSTEVNQTRQAKCKRLQPHNTNANIYYRFFFPPIFSSSSPAGCLFKCDEIFK